MDWNHLNIFKEGHIRIISTKFGKIQPVVKEEISFEAIVDDARRRTTDDGHQMITIAHNEPMAQVS